MKSPDKDEEAPDTQSESVTVEQPSDVDLDDSLQIIPGETPQADDEELEEVAEENPEGIIQPEVGPPEVAASVIVLTSLY